MHKDNNDGDDMTSSKKTQHM